MSTDTASKAHAAADSSAAAPPAAPGGTVKAKDMIMARINELTKRAAEEDKAIGTDIQKEVKELGKAFESLSAEEQVALVTKKYVRLVGDHRKLDRQNTQHKKKLEEALQERDVARIELDKVSVARSRLEELCRELQKQNKRITEESRRMAQEEQQKRQELSDKFQNTIGDITERLEKDSEVKLQHAHDNERLKKKITDFMEQYDLREQHFKQLMRTRELELQLAEAKLQQQTKISQAEHERGDLLESKLKGALETEKQLREQLAGYAEKFEQFQETLGKSNEVFSNFKQEMEKKTSIIKQLEAETAKWRKRYEKNANHLSTALEEHKKAQEVIGSQDTKLERLEKLCRALQTQRLDLAEQVKALKEKCGEADDGSADVKADELSADMAADVSSTADDANRPQQQQQQNPATAAQDTAVESNSDSAVGDNDS